MSKVYRVADAGIYSEQFGDDLVVLNLNTGRYYGFNVYAGLIWKGLIEHRASLDGLVEAGFADAALASCIARLEELGLVSPADHEPQAVPSELKMALEGGHPDPVVELYDDLASIILADPIHDVDTEAGWPNIPVKP